MATTIVVLGIAIVLIGVALILISLRDGTPGGPIRGRRRLGVAAAVFGAGVCIAGIGAALLGY